MRLRHREVVAPTATLALLLIGVSPPARTAPQDASWPELEAIVRPLVDEAEDQGVRVTVAVSDLVREGSRRTLQIGSTETYNPASVIKLALLAALMRQVDRGVISLDAPMTVSPYMVVGGSGTVQDEQMPFDTTVRELARRMVVVSDNTAANVLLYSVGISTVQELLDDLGLRVMKYNRQMFPGDLITDPPNALDAADTVTLLSKIYRGSFLSPKSRRQIILWMKGQQIDTKFGAVLGDEEIAHKTGETDNITHDAGYFLVPRHEVAIVVLTEVTTTDDFDTTQRIGNPIIQSIGRGVYDYLAAQAP